MRATEVLDGRATAYRIWFGDILEVSTGAAQAFLSPPSLGDLLSPWLGSRDTHSQSLSRMLKALQTATESYLEVSISAAEVVVPFPVSDAYLDILRSTCFSFSLHMPMSAQPPAGMLAARACDMVANCNIVTREKASGKANQTTRRNSLSPSTTPRRPSQPSCL